MKGKGCETLVFNPAGRDQAVAFMATQFVRFESRTGHQCWKEFSYIYFFKIKNKIYDKQRIFYPNMAE